MNDPKATQWLTKPDGIARRLAKARGDRSGLSLARELGWQSSKITRLEQGTQIPKPADIEAWAQACGLNANETEDLLRMLAEFTAVHSAMRQRAKRVEPVRSDITALLDTATLVRTYSLWAVPAVLQLPAYATAILDAQARVAPDPTDDIPAAVEARLRRQALLYDQTRRFEILVDESVLYRAHGGHEVLRAQLDRLLPLTGMPSLRFGIVPLDTAEPVWGGASVAVFDDQAFTEQLGGAEPVAQEWLDTLTKWFEQLWHVAVEGAEARDLILSAISNIDS